MMKTLKSKLKKIYDCVHSHTLLRAFTAFFIFSLSSCGIDTPQHVPESDKPLVLGAQQVWVSEETKSPVSGTTFPTTLPMVISAYSSASAATYFSGIPFAYSAGAGGWAASSTKYWPQTGTLDLLAYSAPGLNPTVTYQSNASAGITSFVTGDNRTAQADIMFGAVSGCSYSPSSKPNLSFKHALSLVSFTARCPEVSYNGTTGITIESITLSTAYYGGTCSVTRSGSTINSISWSSNANSYNGAAVPGISSVGLTTTAADVGQGILLPPQTAVNFTVNYKVWSGGTGTSRSYTYSNSGSWEMAKRHVYAIEITMGNEVVVRAGVEDWADTAKNWFYADGNVVKHVGTAFSLSSGQPVYWREGNSGNYELLTYSSGSYGSSVTYSAANYFVTVTKSGSNYTVSYVSKNRTEYGYQLVVSPSVANIKATGSQELTAYLQLRTRTWSGGVAGAWSGWTTVGSVSPAWTNGGSSYASVSGSGIVTGTNGTADEHSATITASWTSHLGGVDVAMSGTCAVTVAGKPRYKPFAGLYIAKAPLYHDGTSFIIKDDDWNHDSYGSTYGAASGSYYFNWNECNEVSNISYDGLSGWRMPTQAEWAAVTTGSRTGSTINGTAGCRYALIQLTGVTHAGNSSPIGLLLAPDGETMTGMSKPFTWNVNSTSGNTGVTAAQLDEYLDSGCVFLPASGYFNGSSWYYAGTYGYYWSSAEYYSTNGYTLYFYSSNVNPSNVSNKASPYFPCRLVQESD